MPETEAVQPFLASLILRLYLPPSQCGAGGRGWEAHSRVCAFRHVSGRSSLLAGSLLLLASELKIDFPKKAPVRWSYQGNLHYQLPASRLIWNSPAFDVLHFFSGVAAFFTTNSKEVISPVTSNLEAGIRMDVRGGWVGSTV